MDLLIQTAPFLVLVSLAGLGVIEVRRWTRRRLVIVRSRTASSSTLVGAFRVGGRAKPATVNRVCNAFVRLLDDARTREARS